MLAQCVACNIRCVICNNVLIPHATRHRKMYSERGRYVINIHMRLAKEMKNLNFHAPMSQ